LSSLYSTHSTGRTVGSGTPGGQDPAVLPRAHGLQPRRYGSAEAMSTGRIAKVQKSCDSTRIRSKNPRNRAYAANGGPTDGCATGLNGRAWLRDGPPPRTRASGPNRQGWQRILREPALRKVDRAGVQLAPWTRTCFGRISRTRTCALQHRRPQSSSCAAQKELEDLVNQPKKAPRASGGVFIAPEWIRPEIEELERRWRLIDYGRLLGIASDERS